MSENSPASPASLPTLPASSDQPDKVSLTEAKTKKRSVLKSFWGAFTSRKPIDDDAHELYHAYEPYAQSARITIQMLIGIILFVVLLLRFIVYFTGPTGIPLLQLIASKQPLELIAYGLFFSTGVDLAYMLFTPGPDEAIDPVMTGLAAAILLGVGNIMDYRQLQLQHGIILFLAVGALAGLFATRKYLFNDKKKETNGKNGALPALPESKVKAKAS